MIETQGNTIPWGGNYYAKTLIAPTRRNHLLRLIIYTLHGDGIVTIGWNGLSTTGLHLWIS